jgi:hypothetical protein
MELMGIDGRDSDLGATGAPDSLAPALPSHAPTPTAAPMDFVQALLRQGTPTGPPVGAAEWESRARLLPWP